MALPSTIQDRDFRNFTENPDGSTRRFVSLVVTNYETRVDEASISITYVGKSAVGSSTSAATWQIQKIYVSGAETIIEWADSNDSFDNVWDNRASLSYG